LGTNGTRQSGNVLIAVHADREVGCLVVTTKRRPRPQQAALADGADVVGQKRRPSTHELTRERGLAGPGVADQQQGTVLTANRGAMERLQPEKRQPKGDNRENRSEQRLMLCDACRSGRKRRIITHAETKVSVSRPADRESVIMFVKPRIRAILLLLCGNGPLKNLPGRLARRFALRSDERKSRFALRSSDERDAEARL